MKTVRIKKSWFLESGFRFDASFHLSDGVNTKRIIEKFCPYPTTTLGEEAEELFKGNIHKRVYVSSPEHGHMFFTASDMFRAEVDSGKYVSKKYSPHLEELELKKDWILITRSGTLGKVVYVTEDYDGKIGTDDLVRIKPAEKQIKRGYLYAYLSSKYGYGLLTQSGYGGVVKHIEPHHLENIKIPILSEPEQIQIHNLIIEASKLRVEANKLLKEAQERILAEIDFQPINSRIAQKVSINTILEAHHKRFEAQYYVSEGYEIIEQIKQKEFKYLSEISKPIFRPGIFKRHYIDKGFEFLGGSDIAKAIPKSDKRLSIIKTPHLEELKIEEDWILVTCGGTIGYSVLVNNYLADKTASQHILRVIADDIKSGYLFAFMSSSLGLKAIQSFTYGSVIPQIEPHHLELLPIPILEEELMNVINNMVMKYKENISTAIENELEAINLIENEIEQWQKS